MSTSPVLEGAENAVITGKEILLEIDVPAGKGMGMYINEFSGFKDIEYEFLLKNGTKCDIISVDMSGNKPIIRMVIK